jgi:hypothetical protein
MPWTTFTDDRGRAWALNQTGLWILVRQHVYNRALRRSSTIVREHHMIGPNQAWVDSDFRASAAERDRESRPLFARLERDVMRDGARAVQQLAEMREQTETAVFDLREMQRSASNETFTNMELSVSRGERGYEFASHFRDFSATTLLVGSSFMTGGAAVAVLGGGSLLRGVARYEEGGNVGAAIMTATGTFVVGAIPLGGGTLKASASIYRTIGGEATPYAEKAAMIIIGAQIDAQFEAANALIDGKSGREALQAAAKRFGIDLVTGAVGIRLERRALPVVTRLMTDGAVAILGDELAKPAPRKTPTPPEALPTPSAELCDANSLLNTPNCTAQDWVRQIVLQEARRRA